MNGDQVSELWQNYYHSISSLPLHNLFDSEDDAVLYAVAEASEAALEAIDLIDSEDDELLIAVMEASEADMSEPFMCSKK